MPFKILVIDDNISDRTDTISGLPALLEREGYEVAATADGETAYDLVFEYKPDLIVLDIKFRRQSIDGVAISRALCRVVPSAVGVPGSGQRAYRKGGDKCLSEYSSRMTRSMTGTKRSPGYLACCDKRVSR